MTININQAFNQYNNWGQSVDIQLEWSSLNIPESVVGTGDVGKLMPIFIREMIPGQAITVEQTVGIQFMPFVSNLFHEFHAVIRHYFVPCRLIDENWEDYIQGGQQGRNTYPMPFIDLKKAKEGNENKLTHTILDYLGYPINNTFENNYPTGDQPDTQPKIGRPAAYPVWAYNKVYNDQIRPIDLQVEEVDKNNIKTLSALWQWDYFTRGQVFQQRGDTPIVPLSKNLTLPHTVETIIKFNQKHSGDGNQWATGYGGMVGAPYWESYRERFNSNQNSTLAEGWNGRENETKTFTDKTGIVKWGNEYVSVTHNPSEQPELMPYKTTIQDHDLNADGVGMDLNDLMISMGIMSVLINNAKINYRYIDFLQQRYGISRQDSRLQLAEYITTEVFQITSQGVVQTSYGDTAQGQTPQGNITAQAQGLQGGMKVKYTAQEHGYFLSIMSIIPATMYEQGLPRLLQTKTRFEWATPELAHMPARETRKSEIYFTQNPEKDNKLFNWTDVYNEYRTSYNRATGLIRPSTPNGLPSYTLCRNFDNAPSFNLEFLQADKADMSRILQYPNEPAFIYILKTDVNTAMPLPLQSNPTALTKL